MARRRRIYEGKGKVIYEGTEPGTRSKRFEGAERTLFTVLFNGLKPR